ncbi:MAG: type VII secretion protein EssC [Lachnospiraceae bacterium]|nr:type VII secretion protein EssC [Lachnospiraceae bacterium]
MENRLPAIAKKAYRRKAAVTIAAEHADVVIYGFPYRIWLEGEKLYIERSELTRDKLYFNGRELTESSFGCDISYETGDSLYYREGSLTVYADCIVVEMAEELYETSLSEQAFDELPFEDFPRYKRSPRLIRKIPTEAIEIERPPAEKKMGRKDIIQTVIPPVIMLCVTIGVSVLMKRGLFVIVSVMSTLMSLVMSVTKLIRDRKECREQEEKRRQMYEDYLLSVRKRLYHARQEEAEAVRYNSPPVRKIEQMVRSYSSRIYERSSDDDDFLKVSVGLTDEPVSYPVHLKTKTMETDRDELEEEAEEVYRQFRMLTDKPVTVDLKRAHMGLVGEKTVIHEQLRLIVAQLAFFHSYHDLEIVTVFHERYNGEFRWMNWYPHLRIHAINAYGCINNDRMRDHVMGSMYRIIKDRKLKKEENKKESRFLPHYLFIIDEPKLIMDHAIMEYLDKEADGLGFSIIYTTNMRASLPANIKTIVSLENSKEGILLLEEGDMINKRLRLQSTDGIAFEWMARDLSVLIHEKGIVSRIPEKVTFFEMYHVDSPDQLEIEERWKKNQAYKSLAVPLGLRGYEDYLYLNLHEKAHGPHGLVAGTTGSGKSEIVQSYILSLAVNFHPHEVGFLLIDYKGGGMADLFRHLPHLLGTITNLDGSESLRAMASIKSELARRQKIFSLNHVNHINDYNKLFKLGEVEEPLPHLFLISDEFAELKKEQPEFMSELVSAARIGRSLGIHLILATQKPSGVVDDQIWTNSRFKLALKVQNESDSREIIKTSDAAFITQSGRAYLQVGNNEIYELFQSAWSGAPYHSHSTQEEVKEQQLVYLVNELGQGEVLNGDLSGSVENKQIEVTQLDAAIEHIAKIYDKQKPIPVKKPWLPPLERQIVSEYAQQYCTGQDMESAEIPLDLKVDIGLVDIPEEQSQIGYHLDLFKDGNAAFFAAPGYGKSVFLTTVLLSLALKNSVDRLNFYICDFGNSALISLNKVPHVCDYISMEDTERSTKLVRIITEEVKRRKRLFADKMVQNFEVYNQTSEEPLKAIVILIDNYDVVKELGQEMEDFFTKLSRDGVGLGIYMIVTATRQSGIKYVALNNYKNKLAGYLIDKSETTGLIGRSSYQPPEIEGRVLVKHATGINLMQVYSMVPFKDEIAYNAGLKDLVDKLCDMYPTKRAPRIPVLPENFLYPMLAQYGQVSENEILLGLHKETVEVRGFDRCAAPFIILGDSARGKTNLLKVILEQIGGRNRIYLFDSSSKELFYHKTDANLSYMENPEEAEDFIEEFTEMATVRKGLYHKALEVDPRMTPRTFYASLEPVYIVVDDVDEFAEQYASQAKKMADCLRMAADTGCGVIVTMHSTKSKGYDDISKFFKVTTDGILLGNPGGTTILPSVPARQLPAMGEGLLYRNGSYERIVLPKFA